MKILSFYLLVNKATLTMLNGCVRVGFLFLLKSLRFIIRNENSYELVSIFFLCYNEFLHVSAHHCMLLISL